MSADREFVSTTGTRHRGEQAFDEFITDCRRVFKLGVVVQRPVSNCKVCYPKGRTE
jgi:hypothetical protein